ncbi:MAG: phosphoribosyl-ATP diphosphatase [Alphaproteobacteria bacterium]
MAQKSKSKKPKSKKAGAKAGPAKIIGIIPGAGAGSDGRTLDGLYSVIKSRRGADPARSHTARMFLRGPAKIAQKFGEEAVEAVIEGAHNNGKALVLESADTLYHLLVLWAACGVKPAQVWKELKRREVRSGIAEKASRKAESFAKSAAKPKKTAKAKKSGAKTPR